MEGRKDGWTEGRKEGAELRGRKETLKKEGRTDRRKDGRTDGRTEGTELKGRKEGRTLEG
jgi:hypothetical protein